MTIFDKACALRRPRNGLLRMAVMCKSFEPTVSFSCRTSMCLSTVGINSGERCICLWTHFYVHKKVGVRSPFVSLVSCGIHTSCVILSDGVSPEGLTFREHRPDYAGQFPAGSRDPRSVAFLHDHSLCVFGKFRIGAMNTMYPHDIV